MTYGQRLKAARLHKGWTQPELERATGGLVGQGTISKIERGDQGNSNYDILLAFYLGVHPLWFYNGDQRYTPYWLSPTVVGDNLINEHKGDYWHSLYKARPLKPDEVDLLTAFEVMTPDQQQDLLVSAKKTANNNLSVHAHVEKTRKSEDL